ncbi:PilN domain-containing protein [Mahella australiensis]|uniref:Fimbrial assembly family protein n=1 Tax=Mahella australiensis (strain DSM 15567 / CIP 107919 / 50-1 BON) TaxID=697281 RepID=F4A392_MAHA5|nr:PilN domain-containing protein [Mahella australiensis]AEE96325.1 Fimbrial assembly family protein [Mahella australiensis 50-1 BON]
MKDFNFMPVLSMKQNAIISTGTVMAIIVMVLVLAVAIIYPYYHTSVLEQQLADIQQQIDSAGASNAAQKVLASKLEKQMAIIDDINKSKVPYSEAEARMMLLVPDGIVISDISYSGTDVKFSGTAPDVASIISFMEALDTSGYYVNNTFDNIDGGQQAGIYSFDISTHIESKD